MPGIFDSELGKVTSSLLLLDICHTTEDSKDNHNNIVQKRLLKVAKCPVYGDHLVYFFYGRPAFRVPKPYYPMCFIFKLEESDIHNIKRKMAFDSGAFHKGRMDKYFSGANAKLDDFLIANESHDDLKKFVKLFFDKNEFYYDSKVHNPLPSFTDDLLKRYINMIEDVDETIVDDRRKTLELQFSAEFDMGNRSPELLIISNSFIDNNEEKRKLEQLLGCSVMFYDQSRSSDFHLIVNGLVRSYFVTKAVL